MKNNSIENPLKMYSHKMKNFKNIFLLFCSQDYLSKHNI